jgi:hypothetical protein
MSRWGRRRGRHQVRVIWLSVPHAVLVLVAVAEARKARYVRASGWCPACQLSSSLLCQAHAADLAEVDALGDVATAIKMQFPEEE